MKKVKAFYSLFLSYLCWFIVPFLLIIYILLQNVLNVYKADILEQNISYSEFIKDSLDEQMKIRETIAYMLLNDDTVMNFDASIYSDKADLVLAQKEIIEILSYCSRYQESILSNALYFENSDIIIDANLVYSVEYYYEKYIKDTGKSFEEFRKYLDEAMSDMFLGADNYFVGMMPIRNKIGGNKKIVSLITFDAQAMLKKFRYLTNLVTKQYLVIADGDNNVLLKSDDIPMGERLEGVIKNTSSGVNSIDDGNVYIIENKSMIKALRYYTLFYTKDILVHFRMMIMLLVIGILVCIGVMTAIAYLVSKRLFTPFMRLAGEHTISVNVEHSKNIESLISDIISNNLELSNEIGKQREMLDNNLFKMFLNNSRNLDDNTLESIFSGRLENFEGNIRCVSVNIKEGGAHERDTIVFMTSSVLQNIEDSNEIRHFSIPSDSEYLIMVMSYKMSNDEFVKIISGAFKPLVEQFATKVSIGIGRSVKVVKDFSKSYEEALIAIETGGKDINIFSGSGWMNDKELLFGGSAKNELEKCVKSGDVANVESYFDLLDIKMFEKNVVTDGIMSYVRFALIDLYTGMVKEAGLDGRKTQEDMDECRNTLESHNFAESFKVIRRAFINLSQIIGEGRNDKRDNVKEQIVDYIDKNYQNPDLSIRQVADEMNISYGHLCKFFKEETGTTVLTYLHKKRIEEAKKMLVNTNMSVLEIAEKTGYLSLGSFAKKFKQSEYMSPTEYRKNNQNQP